MPRGRSGRLLGGRQLLAQDGGGGLEFGAAVARAGARARRLRRGSQPRREPHLQPRRPLLGARHRALQDVHPGLGGGRALGRVGCRSAQAARLDLERVGAVGRLFAGRVERGRRVPRPARLVRHGTLGVGQVGGQFGELGAGRAALARRVFLDRRELLLHRLELGRQPVLFAHRVRRFPRRARLGVGQEALLRVGRGRRALERVEPAARVVGRRARVGQLGLGLGQ